MKGASLLSIYLDFHTLYFFSHFHSRSEEYCILLKKLKKNRLNFGDIFKKLIFGGMFKGAFGYHGNRYDVIKCLRGNLDIPVISQSMIYFSS